VFSYGNFVFGPRRFEKRPERGFFGIENLEAVRISYGETPIFKRGLLKKRTFFLHLKSVLLSLLLAEPFGQRIVNQNSGVEL